MIKIEHVSLTVKNRKILDDISFEMGRGSAVGLVGNNGCGKTMLMKCILGFYTGYEGEIRVGGRKVGRAGAFADDVGFIIERPGFIPYYSGYKNLKILADIRGKIGRSEIEEAMLKCNLEPRLKLAVRKYSMGMRQKLGIAQAIMEDPQILILDEPFNGLDKGSADAVRQLLADLKDEGKTILLTSHHRDDIDFLCDRVINMEAVGSAAP